MKLVLILLFAVCQLHSVTTQSCFKQKEQPCCEGHKWSDVEEYCVPACSSDDITECEEFEECWEKRKDEIDYRETMHPRIMDSDFSNHIDFCHPETHEFHCILGYETNQTFDKYDIFCADKCFKSSPSKSCTMLKSTVCSKCDLNHVKDESGWCNLETGSCNCKDFYYEPTCHEPCPEDKTGKNCSRICGMTCGLLYRSELYDLTKCKLDECICPPGSKSVHNPKKTILNPTKNTCEKCESGSFGENCSQKCDDKKCYRNPLFALEQFCDPVDGRCLCKAGQDPEEECYKPCPDFKWQSGGKQCEFCHDCKNGRNCDKSTGECLCGKYLSGQFCEKTIGQCPPGKTGMACEDDCNCNAPANCSRTEPNDCKCEPNEIVYEDCTHRTTTMKPKTTEDPSLALKTTAISSKHWEWLVMAAILAAGMVMGVSVLGCYKLCCRKGRYIKAPSCNKEVVYRVEGDVVYLSIRNSKLKGQDPQTLISSIFTRPDSMNGATMSYDLPISPTDPFSLGRQGMYKDAPGLSGQLAKNHVEPTNKMAVEIPRFKSGKEMMPKKIDTIRNEYADLNQPPPSSSPPTINRNWSTYTPDLPPSQFRPSSATTFNPLETTAEVDGLYGTNPIYLGGPGDDNAMEGEPGIYASNEYTSNVYGTGTGRDICPPQTDFRFPPPNDIDNDTYATSGYSELHANNEKKSFYDV